MIGKKELLSEILYSSGILSWLSKRLVGKLIVYNYHRLKSENDNEKMLYDEDVFGPKVSVFKKQIKWLKLNTRIISEIELIQFIETSKFPKQICSMITFDDGYIDNYTLAYPILKEEDVPAIFFIPSNTINNRFLGWWDIVSYFLKNTIKDFIIFDGETIFVKSCYKKAKHFFLQKFKLEPYEKTLQLLNKLSIACDVPFPDVCIQELELMNWDQIKEISNSCITIGSHTHNHHVLATLNEKKQLEEVKTSMEVIQSHIGRSVNSLSYPVGGYEHFSSITQENVKKCGYKLAFSFNTGFNKWKNIHNFNIKRISPSDKKRLFSATTLLPELFLYDRNFNPYNL